MSILQAAKKEINARDAALAELRKRQQEKEDQDKAIDVKLFDLAFNVFAELTKDGFVVIARPLIKENDETCGTIEVKKDDKLMLSATIDRMAVTRGSDIDNVALQVMDERSVNLGSTYSSTSSIGTFGGPIAPHIAFRCGFYGSHLDQRDVYFDGYKKDVRDKLVDWFVRNRELLG